MEYKTNIKAEIKAGLENTASIGSQGLRLDPNSTQKKTYIEKMHEYFMALVDKEVKENKITYNTKGVS